MNLGTFGRLFLSQAIAAGLAWALANHTQLQVPFPALLIPAIGAALNAIAAWFREMLPPPQAPQTFKTGAGSIITVRRAPLLVRLLAP